MSKKRLKAFLIFVYIIFAIILLRLADLQIIHYSFYKEKAFDQRRRVIPIAAPRGDIYDRNGRLLATSIDTVSVYINPKIFKDYDILSKALGEKVEPQPEKHLFAWVKRKIDVSKASKIEALKIPGVYFLPEKKRVYPKGNFASQLVGFVGMDNEGLSGIELGMDEYLKGDESSIVAESDPAGYELLTKREDVKKKSQSGMDVYLTVDETVQYVAEKELAKAVKQYKGNYGLLIVLDVKSGEILALAQSPGFNPNEYSKFDPKIWRPRAIDVYEPGSTFKTITMASGLDTGAITLDTHLKPLDQITVGGKIIENSHKVKFKGPVTISYMLEQSINTAVAQIGLKMGKETFYKKIRDFGFGDLIGVGLFGESRGIVREPSTWYAPDIAMMTFGQSIAVTPLQLCAAYAAIANNGVLIKPQLVKRVESEDQSYIKTSRLEEVKRSISKKTADETKSILENVVLSGSGRKAKMENYRVGGKTGTAQKAIEGGRGYMKGHYVASFIGMAPLASPRIVALVLVDDPKGVIWGETVAAPAFKTVVENTLRYLNVRCDIIK